MACTLRPLAASCFVLAMGLVASPCASAQVETDPAAIVRSQERQSAERAADWLGSPDARVRAWGAYLALRDGRRKLLPQLIGLAEAYSATVRETLVRLIPVKATAKLLMTINRRTGTDSSR
jgi:hypothetical protein